VFGQLADSRFTRGTLAPIVIRSVPTGTHPKMRQAPTTIHDLDVERPRSSRRAPWWAPGSLRVAGRRGGQVQRVLQFGEGPAIRRQARAS